MGEIFEILHREFVYIWYYFDVQLRQIFGYWALGILLGSCVSVFLKEKIHDLLRSMSQSRGSFTFHFVRYEECPPAAQEKAIAEAKALAEE